jgi:hypothetical protein
MPTLFRSDRRTWKYVPFDQSDALTRVAFREKGILCGVLRKGEAQVFTCDLCEHSWNIGEIGASFGNKAIGTPICPTDDCMGIGWDFFTEVTDASNL